MQLVKPALDIGLYTNDLDPMLAFWQQQAGLRFSELLPVGGGVHQHRHAIGDSVLKINHSRSPAPTGASGLAQLALFNSQVKQPQRLHDPDGNAIVLNPRHDSAPNLRLTLQVNNYADSESFYANTLGLKRHAQDAFLVGSSEIVLQPGSVGDVPQKAIGFRYMAFQVADVVGEHRAILASGGLEGMAPVRLGDVAYISFVRDPDGNWIEISQRKSITGSLD